ncbi:DNA recombination protein RmuC [Leptolyngbya sp. KIOST-1]|uniref:DNA recombination protein RmuC n=1 Tax=Leptolyngbya sp. KIOST-1 TaxID=1229172 RepID=UPI00068CE4B8|nr:DNA recombination protein RmuC [Leptolyngbya sp. KIOST-1]
MTIGIILGGITVGLVLGAGVTALLLASRLQTVRERTRAEMAGDRASLIERLRHQDQHIEELRAGQRDMQAQLDYSRHELRDEAARRATAEAQLSRLGELEKMLGDRASHLAQTQQENSLLRAKLAELQTQLAHAHSATQEKVALLDQAQQRLAHTFQALSADALQRNNQSFLELAQATLSSFQTQAEGSLHLRQQAIDSLVSPLREALDKVDGKLQALERDRVSAYASLTEQVKSLAISQNQLQGETANLVKALRAPQVRGRWGEMQLRRVVEMAGMIEYCDFVEQPTVEAEGGRLRPDMVIKLPNGRQIIVDSKAPLQGYLESLEATDEGARRDRLVAHARQVRTHLTQLGAKAYWDQFDDSPEFAVLFLPGETFFSAALEHDPQLIEYGVSQSVILATPTTLIALLKAIAYGWRHEKMAENAQMVSALGRELYDRMAVLTSHMVKLRRGLDASVKAFNQTAGCLESRVLVTTRKFKELGAASGEPIETLEGCDRIPRRLTGEPTEE